MTGGARPAAFLVALASFAGILCSSRPARSDAASGAALVVVVTAEPNGSLARRVRAELEGLGVDVLVLKPPGEDSPARAPLDQAARNVGAVAAVRLIVSGEGKVEVWVADRVTGKAVVRELDAPATSSSSDAVVATGAVELLRASLMELHSPEPPRGDVRVTPRIEALALPATASSWNPRLGLDVSAGVELGVDGLGLSAEAGIGLWGRIAGRFGARLLGQATLAPAHVVNAAGSVDVRSQLLGVMASYDFADASAAWVPNLEVGVAAAHVATDGTAKTPFVSATDGAWFAVPIAGAGLAWSFAHGLRLRADALGGWSLPAARVQTPAGTDGRWGAPLITLALGIEVLWGP
jgi:hypothetical protein